MRDFSELRSNLNTTGLPAQAPEPNSYLSFMEKRVEECLDENRRYHSKYVEMRDFAYSQVEMLLRQLNQKRKNSVQNTNLNVYKQLFDKERR